MQWKRCLRSAVMLLGWAWAWSAGPVPGVAGEGYCVVVSEAVQGDGPWAEVAGALVEKHGGELVVYRESVEESLDRLRSASPRYVCFVARREQAGRDYVARISRLMRRFDDDPYTDALWGILTGYDAACALRIARHKEPLVIHRVAGGTEVELSACEEGVWYCELNEGKMVRKRPGAAPEAVQVPADTTKALVDTLNIYQAQLLVTSGHATERDWQIGYRYRNGQFRCEAGQLFGLDLQGRRHPVQSDNPKVYLPVGNCLMGHIDGPDAMALAFMNRAGVYQMVGYTVPTWYGYGGWGMLDYFLEQPGRFTLAEAFFANQQALIHRLNSFFPELAGQSDTGRISPAKELPPAARAAGLTWHDAQGLLYDRDTVAFYGDPAWQARMAPGPLAWEQTLEESAGQYRFHVRPRQKERSFRPVNTNGSQRGGRPIVHFLPHRIDPRTVRIVEGAELGAMVTDSFLLLPCPGRLDPDRDNRLVFQAARAGESPR